MLWLTPVRTDCGRSLFGGYSLKTDGDIGL
nr:MAG TPA: hypothetical protein [Bacteriophage sp.]